MPRPLPIPLALAFLLGVGCAASPPDDAGWFELDPDAVAAPTGRLIGWNVGRGTLYAPFPDPYHGEWRTPERTAAVERLALVRAPGGPAPWVRFSGLQIDGTLGGDGYHFWDYADPDHTPAADDNMAPFEFMALVDEVAAEPLVTLNFGSGTAAEAADYVTHLVGTQPGDPLVDARHAVGHPAPWDVRRHEIGNEVYGYWNTGFSDGGSYSYANPDAANGGDPAWVGRPSSDPADFAARALTYIEAVAPVSPEARFWVPLAQADMDWWGGLEQAIPALEPLLLHPAVEAVVVHHYQVEDAVTAGADDHNDPGLVLAGSALFEPRFADLRERLDALERDEPLQVVVTEYHVAGFFAGAQFELGETAAVGLGIADMLIAYARWDVDHACQHMALGFDDEDGGELLYESWYNPFRADGEGGVEEAPSLIATELFADHLLAQRLELPPTQLPTASFDGGVAFDYPLVQAVAFASDDGAEMTVVALHRDRDGERALWVDLPDGWYAAEASQIAPPEWDAALDDGFEVAEVTWNKYRGAVEVRMPPHSLTAVRFRGP